MGQVTLSGLVVPSILLLAVAALYRYVLYPVILSPLAKIPSAHWSSSVSPIWILWVRFQGRENRTLHDAHQRHGPIVRLSPGEVSINNMDAVKTVYQGGFDKHQWYNVFNNFGYVFTLRHI